ncbi:MarR family winged helix-turn-helix transcriptional regulator [Glutamicibacter halophytocola]|uniref:MarR family transcriptional regulator n=1 Tax=Glutamicibacter halophytocola TaxID=1933880 RepID=A0AA94XXD1_9MICC|nr:MarR family transcriptional regulator [Glutamicibacter halophytocola]ALG28775.1 transcriptional regulator [Glutamicibacter halophytocola]UUX60339.1 MarR family transcriptional regulator [Glutamicibacter halophytocola]
MTGTSKAVASLKVTTDAWESLFRAQVAVMRQITAMPEFGKLSMREYDVLFNLRTCPGGKSRMVELNKQLLISQPSLSRMVVRLEDQGLVVREPDPVDHRATRLSLTDKGLKLQQEIGREHVKHLHELLGTALSEEEFLELNRLSSKLRRAVQ